MSRKMDSTVLACPSCKLHFKVSAQSSSGHLRLPNRRPRLLPCGHPLCEPCLEASWKLDKNLFGLVCQVCNKSIHAKDARKAKDINDFPLAFYIIGELVVSGGAPKDDLAIVPSAMEVIEEDEDEEIFQENLYLLQEKMTSTPLKREEFCNRHQQKLAFVCAEDGDVICNLCCVTLHRGHVMDLLLDQKTDSGDTTDLSALLGQVEQKKIDIDTSIQLIQNILEKMDLEENEARHEIESFHRELIGRLMVQQSQTWSKTSIFINKEKKHLRRLKMELERRRKKCMSVVRKLATCIVEQGQLPDLVKEELTHISQDANQLHPQAYQPVTVLNVNSVGNEMRVMRNTDFDEYILQPFGQKMIQYTAPVTSEEPKELLDAMKAEAALATSPHISDGIAEREIGGSCEVVVSSIIDPDSFFVRYVFDEQLLIKLNARLRSHFQYTDPTPLTLPVQIGTFVVIYTEDQYFRGQVIQVAPEHVASVFFLDYGGVDDFPVSELMAMPDEVTDVPALAMECRLADAVPSKNAEAWSQEAIEFFFSIAFDKSLPVKFERRSGRVHMIDLLIPKPEDTGEESTSITDLMGYLGHAKKRVYPGMQGSIERYEYVNLDTKMLAVGTSHRGLVSAIESPSVFYIQMPGTNDNILFQLRALRMEMEALYSSEAGKKAYAIDLPRVGQNCAVQYREAENGDLTFVRAKVLQIFPSKHKAKVFFVDYGMVIETFVTEMFLLRSDFLDTPKYAVKASLYDVDPKVKTPMDGSVGNWSLDAVEAFRNIALFKDMIVFIEGFDSKGEEYVVSLYQDFEDSVVCVNAYLVEMELAHTTTFHQKEYKRTSIEDDCDCDWQPPNLPKETTFEGKAVYVDEEGCLFVITNDNNEKLEQVNDRLRERYKGTTAKPHELFWVAGQPCVAKFEWDQQWYRGRVIKVKPDKSICVVMLVDYGTMTNVPYGDMRKDLCTTEVPILSTRLKLKDIDLDESRRTEIVTFMHRIFVDKAVAVELVEDQVKEFPLTAKITYNGADISEFIVFSADGAVKKQTKKVRFAS